MVSVVSKAAIVSVVAIAILYQFFVKNLLFNILGYSRHIRSIKEFTDFSCTKVDELGLEACEDMWLHEDTGFLYMACSDTRTRTEWLPAVDFLNASARSLTDRIAVLDTRGAGHIRDRIQWLTIENFSGINGDATLNLHGFDVRANKHSDELHMLIINHRPPIDPLTGDALDASKLGANSTIEQFTTKVGSSSMRHGKTTSNPLIHSPNRVAWVSDHSFVVSNDHSTNVPSLRRALTPFIGGGNVVHCSRNKCKIAWDAQFTGPNGLVIGKDGLIYVPSTSGGYIDVFSLDQDDTFTKLETFRTLPIDNLSVDKNGDIYGAGFPEVWKWIKSSKEPFDYNPGSTILKITRRGEQGKGKDGGKQASSNGTYVVETVMEDDGSVLPGTTTAVHDAETGRIFLAGVMSPFITICERIQV